MPVVLLCGNIIAFGSSSLDNDLIWYTPTMTELMANYILIYRPNRRGINQINSIYFTSVVHHQSIIDGYTFPESGHGIGLETNFEQIKRVFPRSKFNRSIHKKSAKLEHLINPFIPLYCTLCNRRSLAVDMQLCNVGVRK